MLSAIVVYLSDVPAHIFRTVHLCPGLGRWSRARQSYMRGGGRHSCVYLGWCAKLSWDNCAQNEKCTDPTSPGAFV